MASVVRAAGKASVSLVPPVAAAGLWGLGLWEGAGALGRGGEGAGGESSASQVAWIFMKRKAGKGLHCGLREYGLDLEGFVLSPSPPRTFK